MRGLVFGAFGEASEGFHELVHHLIADSMLRGYSKGGRVLKHAQWELGVIVGQVRRILSVLAVKSQAYVC